MMMTTTMMMMMLSMKMKKIILAEAQKCPCAPGKGGAGPPTCGGASLPENRWQ